jgi:hypothetical protein
MEQFTEDYENANKTEKHKLLKSKFSLFNSGMDAFLNCQGENMIDSLCLISVMMIINAIHMVQILCQFHL